jgi:hypothetical protein
LPNGKSSAKVTIGNVLAGFASEKSFRVAENLQLLRWYSP